MATNFTDSPSNGNTIVVAGVTYTYVSANSRWESSGNSIITTSDSAPANPIDGDIWSWDFSSLDSEHEESDCIFNLFIF